MVFVYTHTARTPQFKNSSRDSTSCPSHTFSSSLSKQIRSLFLTACLGLALSMRRNPFHHTYVIFWSVSVRSRQIVHIYFAGDFCRPLFNNCDLVRITNNSGPLHCTLPLSRSHHHQHNLNSTSKSFTNEKVHGNSNLYRTSCVKR